MKRVKIERLEGVSSYKLSKMVADLRCIRGAKKAILRALADRYPNIWAGIETIASDAGFATAQTRKRLRELESEGFITPLTNKAGGRGKTVQYQFNVNHLCSLLEAQTKTQRLALGIQGQNPTLRDAKPNTSGTETQHFPSQNPTLSVGEQRIEQRIEQRKEQRVKQSPTGFAGTSFSSNKNGDRQGRSDAGTLTNKVISYARQINEGRKCVIRSKHVQAIRSLIAESDWNEPELLTATASIIEPLNAFELSTAGDLLSVNLGPEVDAIRKRAEEQRKQAALKARMEAWVTAEQEKYRAELEADLERIHREQQDALAAAAEL